MQRCSGRLVLMGVWLAIGATAACGDDDDDVTDTGPIDTGATDLGIDSGPPPADTGPRDASEPDDSGPPSLWYCVGDVEWPTATATSATFTISFIEILFGVSDAPPVDGLSVSACEGDSACAEPLATGTTDAMGEVELTIPLTPQGFRGFFRLTKDGFVSGSLFLLPPIVRSFVWWHGPWAVFRSTSFAEMASADGRPLDPTKGSVVVLSSDCNYLGGTTSAITTELDMTLDGAEPDVVVGHASVFYVVDPGTVTLVATRRATGEVVGTTEWVVVAGEISQGVLGPTPME